LEHNSSSFLALLLPLLSRLSQTLRQHAGQVPLARAVLPVAASQWKRDLARTWCLHQFRCLL